jgi:hypothetical protein
MPLSASQRHRLDQLFTDEFRARRLRDPDLDQLARSWSARQRTRLRATRPRVSTRPSTRKTADPPDGRPRKRLLRYSL